MRAEAVRTEAVRASDLMDAAWAALIAGRPRELEALERLMERPLAETPAGPDDGNSLERLEMLLAATARNLRVMRGQVRTG